MSAGAVLLRARELAAQAQLVMPGVRARAVPLSAGPFLTVVCRLPVAVTERLCQEVADALEDHPSVVYTPRMVHLTVLKLTGTLQERAQLAFADWAALQPCLTVRMTRLGYTGASAYVVLGGSRRVVVARGSLAKLAKTEPDIRDRVRRAVTVANVARFEAPLDRAAAARLRVVPIPAEPFELRHAELVVTDKLLSDDRTTRLASAALGQAREGKFR